jgi:hypothetical protein
VNTRQSAGELPKKRPQPRGGSRKGIPNKATADIKAAAAIHGPEALAVLLSIAKDAKKPAASRVAAAVALLDRGFGKPAQAITGPGGGPVQFARPLADLSTEELRQAVARLGLDAAAK